MKRLELVETGKVSADVAQFAHERMFVFPALSLLVGANFFDRAEDLDHEHAVMGDDGAAAFADDIRVRHLLRVAHVRDVINDVVGVFLQRVIDRAVERAPAPVVIHSQAAADIHELDLKTHLVQFRVKARGLLHGLFNRQNVGHLGPDVEMQELETMAEPLGLEQRGGGEQLGGGEAELRVFAAAFGPAPRALGQEPRANPDQRLDIHLLG